MPFSGVASMKRPAEPSQPPPGPTDEARRIVDEARRQSDLPADEAEELAQRETRAHRAKRRGRT